MDDYIALIYDSEAVCGSKDAMFSARGPFDTYEAADLAGADAANLNGLDYEVLLLEEG